MSKGLVYLVDDDTDLLASATDWLQVNGFEVRAFGDGRRVVAALAVDTPQAVVSDIRMPGLDGLDLLRSIRSSHPGLPVILLTGHGEVSLAVQAIKDGAEDFLEKPYDADHLIAVLDKAIQRGVMRAEISRLQGLVHAPGGASDGILGEHPSVHRLRERIRTLAGLDPDVLVVGETGTGKELVARALHALGPRADKPFVAINCAAIPDTLFESELFGHARGAFTGAERERTGRLEAANGGTVLLDEIESMPLAAQAKLLRVLQERSIDRVGEHRPRPIDVRFVAAAKDTLVARVRDGAFREDLFYRLNAAILQVPPLRERGEDILLLYAHYAALARRRYGRADEDVSAALAAELRGHPWPGNVRELKARAERDALGIAWDVEEPTASDPAATAGGDTLTDAVRAFEIARIREALDAVGGDVRAAAQRLGIPRRTLSEKIARFGLRGR